jgi:hypothetical protein
MMPQGFNPDVSVTLPRNEWLLLEAFLIVHEMSGCPESVKSSAERIEKMKQQIIKAERAALAEVEAA